MRAYTAWKYFRMLFLFVRDIKQSFVGWHFPPAVLYKHFKCSSFEGGQIWRSTPGKILTCHLTGATSLSDSDWPTQPRNSPAELSEPHTLHLFSRPFTLFFRFINNKSQNIWNILKDTSFQVQKNPLLRQSLNYISFFCLTMCLAWIIIHMRSIH